MGNDVFANGREISCKSADGKSICAFPDVCFTPPQTPATPPGVPIPYPNTGLAKDTTSGSKSVKISGKEVMLKNKSYFKKSMGDEAGCAPKKGFINSKNMGKVYFTSWSPDVKFEGENVVRHLDLTTHNHGSNANEGIPWPYADSIALKPGGDCAQYAQPVQENCIPPPEQDKSKACCDARKCMLVPGSLKPNFCCKRSEKQMTPHHIIPVKDHFMESGGARTGSEVKESLRPGSKRYNADKAPAACVSGHDHGAKEKSGRLKQHGRIGRAYAFMINSLDGETYKYEDVAEPSAEIVAHTIGCDKKCILSQMNHHHSKTSRGDLRKSQQARKGGEKYYEESIPDDSKYFDLIG